MSLFFLCAHLKLIGGEREPEEKKRMEMPKSPLGKRDFQFEFEYFFVETLWRRIGSAKIPPKPPKSAKWERGKKQTSGGPLARNVHFKCESNNDPDPSW